MAMNSIWKAGGDGAVMLSSASLRPAFVALAIILTLASCSTDEGNATKACETMIRLAAKTPSSVEITPPSKVEKTKLGYVIQWEHGSGLRLMNNMGAKLDATALCATFNESPETRNTLFIDDELAYSGALEELKRREARK